MKQFSKSNIEPEWQDLIDEYPEIFLEPSEEVLGWYKQYKDFPVSMESDETDLVNLRYGFECRIGWKGIIREFCGKIRELIQEAKANGHEVHYKTFILKEKFGELRDQGDFYGPDAKLYLQRYYDISNEMEDASHHVCELTGKVGHLISKKSGWLKTLCQEEAVKLGYEWK